MRSVTMYATVLPLANDHVYCSPKINTTSTFGQTVLIITQEVLKLIAAGKSNVIAYCPFMIKLISNPQVNQQEALLPDTGPYTLN